jgi:malate dehydrogenase (oxaloacetate-decarboxylating)(NADP+)
LQGLVTKARYESLRDFKKPYAHEHPACPTLVSAVKALKPKALIGTSGQGGAFTKEGLEEMASYQEVRTFVSLPIVCTSAPRTLLCNACLLSKKNEVLSS